MSQLTGLIACLIAGLGFGSNFIPVKKYKVGDGVFYQWVMCAAIWCVGLCTLAFTDHREFHPLSMLGGALWCTGNFFCVQVIKLLGLSMSLMVWGITNSLAGWASGRFGLFGLKKQHVADSDLNYIGLSFTLVSLAFFAHVKTTVEPVKSSKRKSQMVTQGLREQLISEEEKQESKQHVNPQESADVEQQQQGTEEGSKQLAAVASQGVEQSLVPENEEESDWTENLDPKIRHILGFAGAMACGLFFGLNFDPPEYEIDHAKPGQSTKEFDYIFSHFSGIFATSTFYLLCYCAYMKNQPFVSGELVLPSFGCGLVWAIAQVSWFVAIQNLEMVVANPIVTSLPSVVAGLWGILLFGEIQGLRNLGLWGLGLVVAMTGVILVAKSG